MTSEGEMSVYTTLPTDGIYKLAPSRIENPTPGEYRLFKKLSGELVLEGSYRWSEGCNYGVEWREIPTRLEELK